MTLVDLFKKIRRSDTARSPSRSLPTKKWALELKFDIQGFGARFAYTVDGEALGEISSEA
jgi:hypothetical protein